jgi:hypothetical protein
VSSSASQSVIREMNLPLVEIQVENSGGTRGNGTNGSEGTSCFADLVAAFTDQAWKALVWKERYQIFRTTTLHHFGCVALQSGAFRPSSPSVGPSFLRTSFLDFRHIALRISSTYFLLLIMHSSCLPSCSQSNIRRDAPAVHKLFT